MTDALPRRTRKPRSTPNRSYPTWLAARIRLDAGTFDALFSRLGHERDTDRSRFLKLPHSTYVETRAGVKPVGPKFVAHSLAAFGPYGLGFDDLFVIEVDPAELKAVA